MSIRKYKEIIMKKALINGFEIDACKYCEHVLEIENCFSKVIGIGDFCKQFPVYTCTKCMNRLLNLPSKIPNWCPYVVK